LCTGFCAFEEVPSLKVHSQEVGDPVLVSVKFTISGAFPESGDAEKLATRGFDDELRVPK
jgi:hypothetical protein